MNFNLSNLNQDNKTKYNDHIEEKSNFEEFKSNMESHKMKSTSKIINRQEIFMNNYKKSYIYEEKFILDNLYSNDEIIINKIYNSISNPYQKKLNLINLILNSDIKFQFENYNKIILFFNWLSPLNIEFNMSSKDWNRKTIKYGNMEKILLQNSIAKKDLEQNFYLNYIDLIKKILTNAKINYYYFEFKSKRFTKIIDIIWVFEKKIF